MGPLSAAGSWGSSSDLKVAIRNQSWEACEETLSTPGMVQLSPGENQRLPSEEGWQLLVAGTGPGLGGPYREFVWRA